MSWYVFMSLLAMMANVLLGLYILYSNPSGKLNRLYSLVAFSLAIWSLSEVLLFYSTGVAQAVAINKITSLASSLTSMFLLHFFLVFANVKLSKKRLLGVYVPLFGCSLVDLTTHLISKSMEVAPWGWAVMPAAGYYFFTFGLALYILIAIGLGLRVYFGSNSAIEKKQAILLVFAIAIPLVGGLSMEVVPGLFGIQLFPITSAFSTATVMVIAFAITRYKLMSITTELAAENIIATMEDFLVAVDVGNTIRVVNSSCLKALGYQKEELVGKGLEVLFSLDKTMIKTKDGGFLPVSVSKSEIKTESGVLVGWVMIIRDMRESKKFIEDLERQNRVLEDNKRAMINILEDEKTLEEELKREKAGVEKKVEERTLELSGAKAKLDSSIDNLPLGFLMTDMGGHLMVTNTLAKQILGSEDEKVNMELLKKILEKKVDLGSYIRNCGKEKKRLSFSDIEMNGRVYQFMLSPILVREQQDACIGIVILIQDITESKVLERSKDEFFSIASHELRTPLTAIRGNTSMIQEYYSDAIKDPELNSMITDIHDSSVRLIDIVNDFLNVSRLEQGKMVFAKERLEIKGVISSIISEFMVTSSRKNVNIELMPFAGELPEVVGDSGKVKQVLINLIGNSMKFTPEGKIIISLEVIDNFVKVLVSDTGRGISLKQQNLLFRKFQQAGESLFTRDTVGGTGLGLYISKKMVEGMGGEIRLESSVEGKGSVFSFTLPIA